MTTRFLRGYLDADQVKSMSFWKTHDFSKMGERDGAKLYLVILNPSGAVCIPDEEVSELLDLINPLFE